MQVVITSLSQELSLVDGETSDIVTIQLPDGVLIHAVVDEAATMAITQAFVQSGSAAAQAAANHARSVPDTGASNPRREAASQRAVQTVTVDTSSYSPMRLSDDGGSDLVFGEPDGDASELFASSPSMVEVERNFAQAEGQLAHALGDTSSLDAASLRQAAQQLRGQQSMPVPAALASPRRALRVTADEQGNPIIQGSGLVDHAALLGGAGVEEGDTAQL
jgi:hypothetical protein